jgi:TonB family protein
MFAMQLGKRDLVYSVALHIGLLLAVTMVNPFTIRPRLDTDIVSVNIVTMPPLGKAEPVAQPEEVVIPQAVAEEPEAIPISEPESKTEPAKVEQKKEEKPKPKLEKKEDKGYQGQIQKGDEAKTGSTKGTKVEGATAPGSPFGSVAVDNASFDYPYYFVQAFAKIQRSWSNPVASNQQLSCIIYFKVLRSGTILESEIEKSSGIDSYDRACLRAVRSSNPLPPLPEDFRDDIIGIHLEFPYEPR